MTSPSRRYRRQHVRLIPVPSLAKGPAPTIKQLLAQGERLYSHRDQIVGELRANPTLLAQHDQCCAAEDELKLELPRVAQNLNGHVVKLERSAVTVAISLALNIAMLRTIEARCPHVSWPPDPTGPKVAVSLTARAAICGRQGCYDALRRRWHDDGHCELCEQPTDTFTPHVAPLGVCAVSLEACTSCSTLLKGHA